MFNGAPFISKYPLFIGYIQSALTVDFHSIFTIARSWSVPVINDQRGSQSANQRAVLKNILKQFSMEIHWYLLNKEKVGGCSGQLLDNLSSNEQHSSHWNSMIFH